MRRGHGSTKVPGVKLRPTAPTKSSKSDQLSRQPTWAQSSDPGDVDSTEILRSCKKPFVGIVVCASGLSDKVNLFQQAVQLGAQTSSDLTDRVTHLICEKPGSAKYNYCVEHSIPILLPSWISEAYEKWLSGESIDVVRSACIHRFPAFKTVRLCLTAINDIQRRKEIRKQLEKNGGTFIEALEKDTELTHVLCGPDRGENAEHKGITSKMQFVIKANKLRVEKVHLVWEDWFWDCLEFKGILNEGDYLATGPRPSRKIRRDPSPLLAPIASSAEQKQRHRPSTSTASPLDSNAEIEETANIKRVPEAAALLWESMLKKRGFEMKNGKLMRSPSKTRRSSSVFAEDSPSPPTLDNQRKENLASRQPFSRTESSLNAAFKRSKSFAAKTADTEAAKLVFQRVRSASTASFKQRASSPATVPSSALANEDVRIPEGEKNLFVGLRFRALGEASGPKLTEALGLRGGIVITDPDDHVDFIIVRLVGGDALYRDEPKELERAKFRTECWIEQCIFEERVCAAEEHPAFVPLKIPTPVQGADKLVLHISGLTPAEKTPSVRLIKAIGATVTDQLSRKNTHLICPCGTGPKFSKAQEWKIPILNLQWLFAIVGSGAIPDVDNYLAPSASVAPSSSTSEDKMMTDITNSEFVQGSSRGRTSGKSSDKSQPSTSPSVAAAVASHVELQPSFSDSWVANELLESAPEHPPTSSPVSHSTEYDGPTTPSPIRRHPTMEAMIVKTPAASPFTSPTKPKLSAIGTERVPSSATPSPMRIPSKNTLRKDPEGTTIVSDTPVTATASTLSGESANNLKDAIASLLGKRPSSDDADAESQNNGNAQTAQRQGKQPTRASKRSKPPPRTRSKLDGGDSGRTFSRTTSLEMLGRTGSTLSSYPFDFPVSTSDVESPMELGGIGSMAEGSVDEGMRVTYEDPSQRAEERRLKSLLSGEMVDVEEESQGDLSRNEERFGMVEPAQEEKKARPRTRRRGRNLVRRVTNVTEQS